MNGLSLEFEGSGGQNERGPFLGTHAPLTSPVGKPIGQGMPRPVCIFNIIPISSLGMLYSGIILISGDLSGFWGYSDQFQEVPA